VESPILDKPGAPDEVIAGSAPSSSQRVIAGTDGIERFRLLGRSLDLDVVGAVVPSEAGRQVTWWQAPGAPGLPSRIDDILEGRLQGWIASVTKLGTVFARLTSSSSTDAAATLARHAEGMIAPAGDAVLDELLDERMAAEHDLEPSRNELALVEHAAIAVRRSLAEAGTTRPDALEALRRAIGAADLFVLVERGQRMDVFAPSGERTRHISPEMHASLRTIEPRGSLDDEGLRRMGTDLGLAGTHLRSAFARWNGRVEGLLASWSDPPAADDRTMELLLVLAGCAGDAIEERARASDLLMRRQRARLAYEIHDGVTQAVTNAVLELELLERGFAEDPRGAADRVGDAKEQIRAALGTLRTMLFELSTEPAGEESHSDPFADYVREVAARWKLAPTVDVEGDLDAVPRPILTTAWSIVREALINAAKHSGSSEAAVRATASASELSVEVEDHGRGFDPHTDEGEEAHLGLHMMQTRVSELGGSIDIASSPEVGTRVVAHLPVRNRGDAT
jgi:signal transduction histidine kinase